MFKSFKERIRFTSLILLTVCFAVVITVLMLYEYFKQNQIYLETDYKFSKYYSELMKQQEELIGRINFILNEKHNIYFDKDLVLFMLDDLGLFQDEKTYTYLKYLFNYHIEEAYHSIFGLSRQGNKGVSFLKKSVNKDYIGKRVKYGIHSVLVKDIIKEQLKFTENYNYSPKEININLFYKLYPIIARLPYEDPSFEFKDFGKYLGPICNNATLSDTTKEGILRRGFIFPYPGSIIRRVSLKSILQLLESADENEQFIATCILSYYGMNLNIDVLLDVIKKRNVKEKERFKVAILAINQIRMQTEKLSKELINIYENHYKNADYNNMDDAEKEFYDYAKGNLLNAIMLTRGNKVDEFIYNYIIKNKDIMLMGKFMDICHPKWGDKISKLFENNNYWKKNKRKCLKYSRFYDKENLTALGKALKDKRISEYALKLKQLYRGINPFIIGQGVQ